MGRNSMVTTTGRRSRFAALLVVTLGLGVAACGGGGSKTATAPTTAPPAATSAPSGSNTTATTTGSGTNPGSSFCRDAQVVKAKTAQQTQNEFTDTPAQLQALFKQTMSELPGFVKAAPSQIKSAVNMVASLDTQFYNLLQADGFSFTKLAANPAAKALLQSPSLQQANVTIANYLSKVCGISSSTPPST
jgi:hypothetical protein